MTCRTYRTCRACRACRARRSPAPLTRPSCLALLLLALVAAGCEPERDDPFQVGSGEDEFEDVLGDEVDVISGGQGGQHIWISIRCRDCGPSGTLRYGVTDVKTGVPLTVEGLAAQVDLVKEDEWLQVVGLTGFLDSGVPSIDGRQVKLWAEMDDEAGRTFKDEVEATADD